MAKSDKRSAQLPDDGVLLCSTCGKTIDLNQPDTEAFQCEADGSKFFCSNNCLRQYVLDAGDEED